MAEPGWRLDSKVEITPEMVTAGARILQRRWIDLEFPGPELFAEVAAEILAAALLSQK